MARSIAFTVACVLLAAAAHVLAGGDGPDLTSLGLAGGTVFLAALGLAGRERSHVMIATILVALQAGLHELFNHGAVTRAVVFEHETHGQGLGLTLGMLIAHLTASLLTAWWLARGEAAIWAILRRVGVAAARNLDRLLAKGWTPAPTPPLPRFDRFVRPPLGRVLRHAVVRRGPPLLAGI